MQDTVKSIRKVSKKLFLGSLKPEQSEEIAKALSSKKTSIIQGIGSVPERPRFMIVKKNMETVAIDSFGIEVYRKKDSKKVKDVLKQLNYKIHKNESSKS